MRKSLLLAIAAVMLGGCPGPAPAPVEKPAPTPTPTARPLPWLTVEPTCSGAITRAEWLVCDDKTLNALHRRLALEWESARQQANDEQIKVQRNQLTALISERTACQTAPCVAVAYRRYVSAPPPVARPVVAARPKPRPRPRPRRAPDAEAAGVQSCEIEIGRADALALVRQCTAAGGRQCSIRRSCGSMEERIERACLTWRQPPGFCPRG